jgi:hypothetical protein
VLSELTGASRARKDKMAKSMGSEGEDK